MNLTIDDKVKNTIDPDQWYKGSKSLYDRRNFLDKFDTLKERMKTQEAEEFEFLSILLLLCDNNVDALELVSDLSRKKQNTQFAHDIVDKAIDREKALKSPRLKQLRAQDIKDAKIVAKKVKSTDYYFKLIDHSSIQQVFGTTFYHYLSNMKK